MDERRIPLEEWKIALEERKTELEERKIEMDFKERIERIELEKGVEN